MVAMSSRSTFFALLLAGCLLGGCRSFDPLDQQTQPTAGGFALAAQTPPPLATPAPQATPGPWVSPIKARALMNPFGNSYTFYDSLRSGHTGVDLAAPVGTPVYAVADGVVVKTQFKPNMRYGYYLVIAHDQKPYFTLYGHLSRINVKLDARVRAGERIGASGESGLASYPHLHFELLDRLPIHDGAWGYRYICARNTAWIQMLDKKPMGKVAGIGWLATHIGFVDVSMISIHSYLRMDKNQCVEKPIPTVTYYDPEPYLPKYPHAPMPDLSGRHGRSPRRSLPLHKPAATEPAVRH